MQTWAEVRKKKQQQIEPKLIGQRTMPCEGAELIIIYMKKSNLIKMIK